MPGIEDFKKSLSKMSDDELDELVHTTRNNRTKPKPKPKKKKKKKKKKKSSSKGFNISDLSEEEAKALLEKLQNS